MFKKKVIETTLSGSDDSSDENESEKEKANLCFITKNGSEDKVNNSNLYSLNEPQDAFDS